MAMKMLNGKQPKSMQSFMRSLFHRLSSEGILYSVYSIFSTQICKQKIFMPWSMAINELEIFSFNILPLALYLRYESRHLLSAIFFFVL